MLEAPHSCSGEEASCSEAPSDDNDTSSKAGGPRAGVSRGALGGEETEEDVPSSTRSRKRKQQQHEDSRGPPVASVASAAAGGAPLIRLCLQGAKLSLRDHIAAALPRCRLFIAVGGSGAIDSLMQRKKNGLTQRHKRLRASHIHGTLKLQPTGEP